MPCNDARCRVDENGIEKAELRDAGRDLAHLFLGVRAGILVVRDKFVRWPDLDAICHAPGKFDYHVTFVTSSNPF